MRVFKGTRVWDIFSLCRRRLTHSLWWRRIKKRTQGWRQIKNFFGNDFFLNLCHTFYFLLKEMEDSIQTRCVDGDALLYLKVVRLINNHWTSQATQWWGFHPPTAGGTGSIPSQGIKILHGRIHMAWSRKQKSITTNKKEVCNLVTLFTWLYGLTSGTIYNLVFKA